jgi:hypothetical protein
MNKAVISMRWRSWAVLGWILLVLQMTGSAGSAWGQTPFDWELFGIDKALLPDLAAELRQRDPLLEGAGIRRFGGNGFGIEKAPVDEDRLAPETRFGYFHLFLSRYQVSGADRDIQRPNGSRTGTVDRLKTLPGDLRSNPGRAFESMGEIFQPQLNLGIEF